MACRRALLIEDERSFCRQFETVLQFIDYEVHAVSVEALERELSESEYGVVFVVVEEINEPALAWLAEVHRHFPVVLVGERNALKPFSPRLQSLAAAKLEWPTTYAVMDDCLEKLFYPDTNATVRSAELFRSLAGNSAAIQQTRKLIQQVAGADATVLVLGESGTGKEVIARNLHYYSTRRLRPFVPVNCGAIPAELLESELFGHEKGAFTGALSARQGRFELAEGGTLFLDEIGDTPLSMQVKLLRVLQERSFERVGSNRTIHCDVRIVAATHRNLDEEIRQNRFREDLFYRLNVFPIQVPALRERCEDVPVLVADLTARLKAEKKSSVRLTSSALRVLQKHHWPGNVRELANLIERLAILYPNGLVDVADLPEKFQLYAISEDMRVAADQAAKDRTPGLVSEGNGFARLPQDGLDLREHLNYLECELIKQALDECNGVVAHAANLLRMRRTTLVEKLRKYGLRGEETSII